MKKLFKVFLIPQLVIVLFLSLAAVPTIASPSGIVNPDFETGNLAGWSISIPSGGTAQAVMSWTSPVPNPMTYNPKNGSYFALLKTDGPGSFTTIWQSFSVPAGAHISGWAFFKAGDYNNDNAQVRIMQGTTLEATPFYADVHIVGAYGWTPWTYWHYTFTASGTYTVEARVANWGDNVFDSYMGLDDIVLIANKPPDTSGAYADQDCLWPPNHKFVDVSIMGVTDPDDDPVTITIDAITSDEPTSSDEGSGGANHAPDAYGVGTDTASVRAERSGDSDGRVYVIYFTASDDQGGECEGSVIVKVPHDQSDKTCPAIDSGKEYDATGIN